MSTKGKTTQTKQDISKQPKKILSTNGRKWHENIPATWGRRNRTILDWNMATKRKHNEKAEWINNMIRELEGLEEARKRIYTSIFLKMTLNNIKLENAWPWWNTWLMVQEIHLHSRQTSTRNEEMPTRSTRTRIDDQRKDHHNPKDPSEWTAPNNYRPIICLTMMWKILTA